MVGSFVSRRCGKDNPTTLAGRKSDPRLEATVVGTFERDTRTRQIQTLRPVARDGSVWLGLDVADRAGKIERRFERNLHLGRARQNLDEAKNAPESRVFHRLVASGWPLNGHEV